MENLLSVCVLPFKETVCLMEFTGCALFAWKHFLAMEFMTQISTVQTNGGRGE